MIDDIKGIASQLIVLHHLAFYGPMSDVALELAPDLIRWLYDYGRLAVQAFLVIGGFLAARWLAPEGVLITRKPLRLISRRYLKLIVPLMAALICAMLAATVARALMEHDSVPGAPSVGQILAHALLIHGITGTESLSAGVWYVAIDFQLFILLVALLTISRNRTVHWTLVALLTVASLFFFNRHPEFDNWGVYFFGAYGLGAFAYWSSRRPHAWRWMALLLAIGLLALLYDYRLRIALALAIALFLAVVSHEHLLAWPKSRLLGWLGRISYSVFLIHFPVCLLVSTVIHRINPDSPAFNLFGMLLAWSLSAAAGNVFYRQVESRARPETFKNAARRLSAWQNIWRKRAN